MFLVLFPHGPFTPKEVDMQSELMSINYTCKYHDIDRCSNEMYVMRSADVENMYLSHTEKPTVLYMVLELTKVATYIIEVIFL